MKFKEQSLKKNNKLKLKRYKPCNIHLSDLNKFFSFSFKHGLQELHDFNFSDCDISVNPLSTPRSPADNALDNGSVDC